MPLGVQWGHARPVALVGLVLLSVALPGAGVAAAGGGNGGGAGGDDPAATAQPATAGSAAASSVARTYDVSVVDTGSGPVYRLDGEQRRRLELVEGRTYRFVLDESAEGHPFHLSTSPVGGTDAFPAGQVTRGVVVTDPYRGNEAAADAGTVFVTVPEGGFDAGTLYYQSATDQDAGARITTVDGDGTPNDVLIVDGEEDGDDAFASIGAAVDAASSGDRVEIAPGTYREQVTIDANVTVVAPAGATLDGLRLDRSGDDAVDGITIPEGSAASPWIEGLTITGYDRGVVAARTSGDWTLRDVTVRNSFRAGVRARYASGDWTIAGSRIAGNAVAGLVASYTSGAWTVRDTVVAGNGNDGVAARQSAGGWTIRDARVANNGHDGVDASADLVAGRRADGWTIRDARVANNGRNGIVAGGNGGDWTILDTIVANHGAAGVLADGDTGNWTIRNATIAGSGTAAVSAESAGGAWTIRRTVLADAGTSALVASDFVGPGEIHLSVLRDDDGGAVVDATSAATRIDATLNYWGTPDGAGPGDCVGNVTCRLPLADAPDAGADVRIAPVVGDVPPTDPDGDGRYEDVNGDGVAAPGDASVLFDAIFVGSPAVRENVRAFDFNGDGQVTPGDANVLFEETL